MGNKPVVTIKDNITELMKRVHELEEKQNIPLDELFPLEFIRRQTKVESIEAFVTGMGVQTAEEFAAISEQAIDTHVREVTNFESWTDMITAGYAEYVSRKLGL